MILIKLIAISLMMSSITNAYKMLVLAPFPYNSNWIYMETIIKNLLKRGHEITSISPYKYSGYIYENYKLNEIAIPKYPIEELYSSKDIFRGGFESDIKHIQTQYKIGLHVSEQAMNESAVKKLIRSKDKEFDVVIADNSHQESLYMFAYKFKCPLITVDINSHSGYMDDNMGIITSHSFVPHPVTKYEKNMTYLQRCYNTLLYYYETAVRKFSYMPAQNKLARKYFRDSFEGEIPNLLNVEKNISVMLTNTHRVTNTRPKMSAQVDIAGAHLKEPEALPSDVEEIISNSQHSIIYFSLGAYLKPSEMPQEKLTQIMETFRNIKKLIFWKYDGDIPANLPPNVIIQKWFPQNDLLAKRNVVLFITNGGTLSFQEALYHQIPMLIIPFTGEQYRNGQRVDRNKLGKMLLFDDLNEVTLTNAIQEITDDKTYFAHATAASKKFLDTPVEPIKEAIYWIEHAAKYKFIDKSPSVNFCWVVYYNLDVAAFYFAILLICIVFWIVAIKLILRRYRKREERGKFKYY